MKKRDTQIDTNKTKMNYTKESNKAHKNTQKEKNHSSNQWEFHTDDNRHGQPKLTGGTQEIPRQQK
jgi:hypothetical protein